jgi:hypothetical protein
MKGEWCYFKSYFSIDYWDSIIEKSKGLQFQTVNPVTSGVRYSSAVWFGGS